MPKKGHLWMEAGDRVDIDYCLIHPWKDGYKFICIFFPNLLHCLELSAQNLPHHSFLPSFLFGGFLKPLLF